MDEYFAVIDAVRQGPFATIQEASAVLKEASKQRGYTDEEAQQFFLYDSSVIKVEEINGQLELFNVGWQARENARRAETSSEDLLENSKWVSSTNRR